MLQTLPETRQRLKVAGVIWKLSSPKTCQAHKCSIRVWLLLEVDTIKHHLSLRSSHIISEISTLNILPRNITWLLLSTIQKLIHKTILVYFLLCIRSCLPMGSMRKYCGETYQWWSTTMVDVFKIKISTKRKNTNFFCEHTWTCIPHICKVS